MIPAVFQNLCSVCNRDLRTQESENKLCSRYKKKLCTSRTDALFLKFSDFFKKIIGEPRSLQSFWAKRIFSGESFACVAPTGIGKTSFGIGVALFLSTQNKRSYIVLPTALLVRQVVEKLEEYSEKAGINPEIAYYHSGLKKKEEMLEKIKTGDFQILVTTTQFLSARFDIIKGKTFDFIFVDDVDAILKASRNVDKILMLLGFKKGKKGFYGRPKGILMVSTATSKPGRAAELFRKLLNFDVGSSSATLRNIEDVILNQKNVDKLKEILKKLGSGGIIYTTSSEEAEELAQIIENAGVISSKRKSAIEAFEKGEIDYLVGSASYYGSLVRGLDMPERIRFAVFYGAPSFRVKIEDISKISTKVLRILAMIFRKQLKLSPEKIRKLSDEELEALRDEIREIVQKGTEAARDVVVRRGEVVFPDIRTYLQGSGRTSRLYAGGLTKGCSIIMEEDEELIKAFEFKARAFDITFKRFDEVDWENLLREIEETRKRFRIRDRLSEIIEPVLFVVESPTKAKQIARFFGKPSTKIFSWNGELELVAYEVASPRQVLIITACLGHITDLSTEGGFHGVLVNGSFVPMYSTIKRCRKCGYQFTSGEKCRRCGSEEIDDSRRRIQAIRRIARQTGRVIIGTDPDAEGEKIAWDLKNLLAGCGEIKRAEFHEVTPRAIMEALSNLRDVDEKLVKAQIVRRVEDRWIGFTLSQKLWQEFGKNWLSAGRAQTPVLGWIISREEESREKKRVGIIRELDLAVEGLNKEEVTLKIEKLEEKKTKLPPPSPYTTELMLQDAGRLLKLSPALTMKLAQDLFEQGYITYHRTDSTRVSDAGLRVAREYLGESFKPRVWKSEGAHECIRPTRAITRDEIERLISEGLREELTENHLRLYNMIFRRFMASQAGEVEAVVVSYSISVDGKQIEEERIVEAAGKARELFPYYIKLRKRLPTGEVSAKAQIRIVPKALPYTQAEIIGLMKARGIGRPSTYATIVDKLFMRSYVKEIKGRVISTKLGRDVYSYLMSRYSTLLSEQRTRTLESKMLSIEKGELDYQKALEEVYEEIKREVL